MKKGAKHPSPSRATALAHRCVVTHRIGLLSVTLRSDIVALLRKKIEFVKKSAPQRAERIVALARIRSKWNVCCSILLQGILK